MSDSSTGKMYIYKDATGICIAIDDSYARGVLHFEHDTLVMTKGDNSKSFLHWAESFNITNYIEISDPQIIRTTLLEIYSTEVKQMGEV